MLSPTSFITNHKQSPEWESENLVAQFTQLASVPNHPYLSHVPPLPEFASTHWFLLCDGTRKIWEEGNLVGGVEWLALKLDREWPEWAAYSANVLGVLLHPLLDDFYPWLESLLVNKSSPTITLQFEQCLFKEAQRRHTWDWWRYNHKSKPATCFKPSLIGGNEKIVMASHPVDPKTKRSYSWRVYYERELKKPIAKKEGETAAEDEWVLLD